MFGNLFAFFVLLCLAGLSFWLNKTTQLMLPTALIGMVILLCALLLLKRVPKPMENVSGLLLKHISLFFIPITLSVLVLQSRVLDFIGVILVTIIVSTTTSMLVSAWVYQKLDLDTSNDD